MKVLSKVMRLGLIVIVILVQLVFMPVPKAYATDTSPSLGAAASYSVLGGSTVTNTGATTMVGDLGVSPGSAVTGNPTVGPPGQIRSIGDAALAQLDNAAAFLALSAAPNVACDGQDYGAITKDLVGLTLTPGVYCANAFTLSGTLTLDDTGAANGVWIFRSAATLGTSSGVGAKVQFLNGIASPCNVWWKEVSSATIGVGTTFIGNILASTSIALQTNATLNGRAFAQTGAVTLDTNTITGSSCLGARVSAPVTTLSAAGAPIYYCPPLNSQIVAPMIIDSRRIDADSIFISWGPYSGTDKFNVEYGTENGKWLYNTNVTGFSTTINNLPLNQPIWVRIAARNDCAIGSYGLPTLVGGPGLPNTGLAPRKTSTPWYVPAGILIGISILLILVQRKNKFSSGH